MPKCSFSGKNIPRGTGMMYVKKDGKILWFASSKEYKNFTKHGRKARTTKWTELYRSLKDERKKEFESGEKKKIKKADNNDE